MSRLAPLALVVLALATACVADEGPRPSYYRDGYYGGSGDGYRAGYYDRSGGYGRSRPGSLYHDRHVVTDYNRPGP